MPAAIETDIAPAPASAASEIVATVAAALAALLPAGALDELAAVLRRHVDEQSKRRAADVAAQAAALTRAEMEIDATRGRAEAAEARAQALELEVGRLRNVVAGIAAQCSEALDAPVATSGVRPGERDVHATAAEAHADDGLSTDAEDSAAIVSPCQQAAQPGTTLAPAGDVSPQLRSGARRCAALRGARKGGDQDDGRHGSLSDRR